MDDLKEDGSFFQLGYNDGTFYQEEDQMLALLLIHKFHQLDFIKIDDINHNVYFQANRLYLITSNCQLTNRQEIVK